MYTTADLAKQVDKILAYPRGEKRWRATVDLYSKFNMSTTEGMTAYEELYAVKKMCAEKRALNVNKFGTSGDKNSDIRGAYEMPTGLKLLLKMVDPEIDTKQNAMKVWKAFPEFRTSEAL